MSIEAVIPLAHGSIFRALIFLVVGSLTTAMVTGAEERVSEPRAEPAYTNRLIDSANPYLLQHAHNPVDWYPWGPEALAKAKRENRPIFLSIGYSTCYWCHVAEQTLFSNPRIATLMNQWFVNVKVDREERPDLDALYMLATGMLTGGSGGWPNNVFLTPELEPFYAGGYFPPEDDESGRPGFVSVLTAIHDEWVEDPQRMKQRAAGVTSLLRQRQSTLAGKTTEIDPQQWLTLTRDSILKRFDSEYGGLGGKRQQTKFPESPAVALMLTDAERGGDPAALRFVTVTLDAMAYGAIYDQLGGGFHRYSTERTWSIPHFEKMLYDNTQLLGLYSRAWQLTREPQYKRIAVGTRNYLRDRMQSPGGGFYTAEDASVEGEEGATYVWTRTEIESVLGGDSADFLRTYSLTPLSGALDAPGPEDVRSALRVRHDGATDASELERQVASLEAEAALLRSARATRPLPVRDEKILVAWNGLAIDAFVTSGRVFTSPQDIAIAQRAAQRIWDLAWNSDKNELSHQIFRGRAQGRAFLEDYAMLGRGLLSLYEATGAESWLQRAITLSNALLNRFDGDRRTVRSPGDENALLFTPMDEGDGPYPSGTSAAVDFLLRLGRTTEDRRYIDGASRFARRASGHPEQWPTLVAAISDQGSNVSEIAQAPEVQAAQTASHVRVSATSRSTAAFREIVITLDIEPGYHVNANPASFDFLIPTTVAFASVQPIETLYPPPIVFNPSFAPDALNVYEGSVQLVAKLKESEIEGMPALTATLNIQACTETVCMPPAHVLLTIRLDTIQQR